MTQTAAAISLSLVGRIVPKARPRHHGNQSYLPNNYRTWKQDAISQLQEQYRGEPIPRAVINIEILGSARGDLDNLAGAILDALVQAGVLLDDRLSCLPDLRVLHRPGKLQGARVTINPM